MHPLSPTDRPARAHFSARQISRFAARLPLWVARLLSAWAQRRRSRNALVDMPEHLLRDIGLSTREAHWEARKWFWRP